MGSAINASLEAAANPALYIHIILLKLLWELGLEERL
jgi:hypothetical protein